MAFSFSMRGIKELNWANRITLLRIGAILPILLFIHFPAGGRFIYSRGVQRFSRRLYRPSRGYCH